MHKKIITFIALMFTLTWAVPAFAQGEPLWWNPGQAQKEFDQKVQNAKKRHQESMMDVNGNCRNGFRDNVTKEEAQAFCSLMKDIGNGIKKGWDFCVGVCTGTYKPNPPKHKSKDKPKKKTRKRTRRN